MSEVSAATSGHTAESVLAGLPNRQDITLSLSGGVCSIVKEINGKRIEKICDSDDLMSLIASETTLQTDMLPPGTRFYKEKGGCIYLMVEIPPAIKQVKLVNTKQKETILPMPGCAFLFVIGKRKDGEQYIHNTYMGAIEKPILSPRDELHQFPYGNIYDEGNICWGKGFDNNVKTLLDLRIIIQKFFISEFNGDLIRSMPIRKIILELRKQIPGNEKKKAKDIKELPTDNNSSDFSYCVRKISEATEEILENNGDPQFPTHLLSKWKSIDFLINMDCESNTNRRRQTNNDNERIF